MSVFNFGKNNIAEEQLSKDSEKGAIISPDDKYRYALWRIWDHRVALCMFVMLNPSTADGRKDDPTIKKCMAYAKGWGYGGIYIGNLYAYRSRDPKALAYVEDPVGADCDAYLDWMADKCEMKVAAWGNNALSPGRIREIKKLISPMYCLELSKSRNPKHPLYLSKKLRPVRFN